MTAVRQIVFAAALLSLSSSSNAADSELSRESLRGATTLTVLVENLDQDAIDLGLTVEQLRTAVELKLRLAGIKVVSNRESAAVPGGPYVYVAVSTIGKSPGIIAYNVDVSLEQRVRMERNPGAKALFASAWSAGSMGTAGSSRATEAIKTVVSEQMDKFLNAYLSVNPK